MVVTHVRHVLALCLIGCLFLPSQGHTNDERSASFVSVQLENDSIGDKSDGYYTSGIEVALLRGVSSPPDWLAKIANGFPFYESDSAEPDLVSYAVGQKIYTPVDTQESRLITDDRPYAAYLYASVAIASLVDHGKYIDSGNMLELTLGVVGPSAQGEFVQNAIHQVLNYQQAEGWEHQLEDEVTLGLAYSRIWRMVASITSALEYGINTHLSMALGNAQTYGAAGVMLRLGDNLKRDLNPPNISPGFPGVAYYHSKPGVDWYLFLGKELRWVGRDIFLDGNTFGGGHSVDKEPVVGDVQYGIVFLHRDIRLSLSHMVRSREFKTQSDSGHYTAINLSLRY